jgi:hypothetical protein
MLHTDGNFDGSCTLSTFPRSSPSRHCAQNATVAVQKQAASNGNERFSLECRARSMSSETAGRFSCFDEAGARFSTPRIIYVKRVLIGKRTLLTMCHARIPEMSFRTALPERTPAASNANAHRASSVAGRRFARGIFLVSQNERNRDTPLLYSLRVDAAQLLAMTSCSVRGGIRLEMSALNASVFSTA